jgi:hypothetical protein
MAQNLSFLANLRRKMMERAKRLEKVGSSFVGGWYWSSGPQFSDFMSHGCERKLKSKRFLKNTFNRKSNGNLISQLKILIIEPFLRLRARITLFLRRSKQQHVHRHAPKSSARLVVWMLLFRSPLFNFTHFPPKLLAAFRLTVSVSV